MVMMIVLTIMMMFMMSPAIGVVCSFRRHADNPRIPKTVNQTDAASAHTDGFALRIQFNPQYGKLKADLLSSA